LIVSVDEASRLYTKSGVMFIDTRNYWKFEKGHIPGAFNLELYAFHWIDTSKEGVRAFVKQMQMLFRSLGINNDTEVIFYQKNSGYDAARGVWLLSLLGHKHSRLLDGGFNLWKRKSLPISRKDPQTRKMGNLDLKMDNSTIADLDFLLSGVSKKTIQVLDTRKAGEFSGRYQRARKGGHIPGAENREWALSLRRDGSLKDSVQLANLFQGLSNSKEVVTYCQSGYRAAHAWLVLNLIGFENVRNYPGSWYEWGNDPRTAAVKQ